MKNLNIWYLCKINHSLNLVYHIYFIFCITKVKYILCLLCMMEFREGERYLWKPLKID